MRNLTLVRRWGDSDPEPWVNEFKYEYRSTYLFCSFIFLAIVCHVLQLLRQVRPKIGCLIYKSKAASRFIALVRSISYIHIRGWKIFHLPQMKTCINYVKAHHSKERTFSDEVNTKAASDVTNVVDLEQQEPGFVKEHRRSISPELKVDAAIQQSMIQSAQVVAFLDGPYGFTTDPSSYDHLLLCAGGTGIAHVFPIAHHLLRRSAEGSPNVITKRLRLVWSTHSTGLLDWIEGDLKTFLALKQKVSLPVDLDIYVTGEAMGSAYQTFVQTLVTAYGIRANVHSILEEEIYRAMKMESMSMAVYVCGPTGLAHDMSNSVAAANWELAKGNMGSLHDIYLDVESFNW